MKKQPLMVVDGHTIEYRYELEVRSGLVGIRDTEWKWNFLLKCLKWKPLLPPDAWSDILMPLSVYGTVIAPNGTFRTYSNGAWNYYNVRTGERIFLKDVKAMYAYEFRGGCAFTVAKLYNNLYAVYAINKKGEGLFGGDLLEYVYIDTNGYNKTIFAKKLGGSWYMTNALEPPDQYMRADHEYIADTCIEKGYWHEYRELENDLRTLWIVEDEAFKRIGPNPADWEQGPYETTPLVENTHLVDEVGIPDNYDTPEANPDDRVKAHLRTVIGIPERIGEHQIIRRQNLSSKGDIVVVIDHDCRFNFLIHNKDHDCKGYEPVYHILLSENDWCDDIEAEVGKEFYNSEIIRLHIRDRFYTYHVRDGWLEPEPCRIENSI